MTIRNRIALFSSGSWSFYLPPFNARYSITPIVQGGSIIIPFGGIEVPDARRHGWTIDFEADIDEASIDAALALEDLLMAALFDSDGIARVVRFCEWADTALARDRIYDDCKCVNGPNFPSAKFEQLRRFSFQLISTNPARSSNNPPGSSTYETFVINGDSGSAAVPIAQLTYQGVHFTGLLAITSATNIARMQKRIVLGGVGNYNITGIQVSGAQLDAGASGDTIIVVSDAEWDGGGNNIAVTLDETEYEGSNTGSFTVAAGASIYVYMTAILGGHGDMDIIITGGSA